MLKYRLVSATILLSLLSVAVFGYNWTGAGIVFSILALTFAYVGLKEYFAMTDKLGLPGFPKITIISGCAYLGVIAVSGLMTRSDGGLQAWGKPTELLVMYAFFLACVIGTMRSGDLIVGVKSFVASLAGFFYLCWTLSFLVKVYFYQNIIPGNFWLGPYLMFFAIMVTKSGDIGGYTFGKTCHSIYGKTHKLVPTLSPGKSWEGFVGCIIFSSLVAVVLVAIKGGSIDASGLVSHIPFMRNIVGANVIISYPAAVVLGLILSVLGLVGDLIESCFKRAAGVKDSGTILPGMGGMLDALDSLVLTAPLFYVYLSFVG